MLMQHIMLNDHGAVLILLRRIDAASHVLHERKIFKVCVICRFIPGIHGCVRYLEIIAIRRRELPVLHTKTKFLECCRKGGVFTARNFRRTCTGAECFLVSTRTLTRQTCGRKYRGEKDGGNGLMHHFAP